MEKYVFEILVFGNKQKDTFVKGRKMSSSEMLLSQFGCLGTHSFCSYADYEAGETFVNLHLIMQTSQGGFSKRIKNWNAASKSLSLKNATIS